MVGEMEDDEEDPPPIQEMAKIQGSSLWGLKWHWLPLGLVPLFLDMLDMAQFSQISLANLAT